MAFLHSLESLRTPFLDQFFFIVTYLGSEVVFLVLAVALYWCVSKPRGLYLLAVGFFGTVCNQFLKLACRVPRPWVRDPDFTIVEQARADAGGYSFPSGHTQNVVGTMGCLIMDSKRTWVRVLLAVLAALTAFSRMYLGVHTPWDVGVSLVLAVLLVLVLHPVFRDMEEKPGKFFAVWAVMVLCGAAFLLYAEFWPFPTDMDPENYAEGVSNAYKLMGALLGMGIGYAVDCKWIRFRTEAPLPGQILKCVLGLGLLLALKEGLKVLLGTGNWASALRYGLMIVFAAGIWPLTFPFFAKIGRKKEA